MGSCEVWVTAETAEKRLQGAAMAFYIMHDTFICHKPQKIICATRSECREKDTKTNEKRQLLKIFNKEKSENNRTNHKVVVVTNDRCGASPLKQTTSNRFSKEDEFRSMYRGNKDTRKTENAHKEKLPFPKDTLSMMSVKESYLDEKENEVTENLRDVGKDTSDKHLDCSQEMQEESNNDFKGNKNKDGESDENNNTVKEEIEFEDEDSNHSEITLDEIKNKFKDPKMNTTRDEQKIIQTVENKKKTCIFKGNPLDNNENINNNFAKKDDFKNPESREENHLTNDVVQAFKILEDVNSFHKLSDVSTKLRYKEANTLDDHENKLSCKLRKLVTKVNTTIDEKSVKPYNHDSHLSSEQCPKGKLKEKCISREYEIYKAVIGLHKTQTTNYGKDIVAKLDTIENMKTCNHNHLENHIHNEYQKHHMRQGRNLISYEDHDDSNLRPVCEDSTHLIWVVLAAISLPVVLLLFIATC